MIEILLKILFILGIVGFSLIVIILNYIEDIAEWLNSREDKR